MQYIFVSIGAYLVGSLSFAHIISKVMGLPNPESYGSRNAGATNVLRTGNKKAAYLVLLGDMLKGVLVILLVRVYVSEANAPYFLLPLSGLAVFFGHLFPAFFSFKGGKGVATSAGVLLALEPVIGLTAVLVWLAVALITHYSSLAALTSAMTILAVSIFSGSSLSLILSVTTIFVLIVLKHKQNIKNLISGEETKIVLNIRRSNSL